jgi:GcrA cell cycle regulator
MHQFNQFKNGWTDERVADLKKMWQDGLPASAIANRLGGVTRNAVIGKCHRLKLRRFDGELVRQFNSRRSNAARPSSSRAMGARVFGKALPDGDSNKSAERAAEGKAIVAAVEADRTVLSPDARPWEERERGQCAWPIGETGAIKSCCNPVPDDSARPYCAGHARIMGGRPVDPKSLEKLEGWIRRMERTVKAA